jgi:BirA family transcriptional regulator, biotin operon repressor / biotin---[acetyl-CoA-carboxylase] ligase
MATPFRSVTLDAVPSTMDAARDHFTGDPVLVTAARQTEGRGRAGREWVHADRAVAASLAFAPGWPPDRIGAIPLVAGLAAAHTFGVGLKWPNDLLLDEASDVKVGGILAEGPGDPVIVGLGVNLFWPNPIQGAAGLWDVDPGAAAAADLAGRWAADLLGRVAAGPADWGRADYGARCVTIGRAVTWEPDGRGRAVGVDDRGRLVVDTGARVAYLDSGEISHLRAE